MRRVNTAGILSWNKWQGNRFPGANRPRYYCGLASRYFPVVPKRVAVIKQLPMMFPVSRFMPFQA
jgi:hypothetical protein